MVKFGSKIIKLFCFIVSNQKALVFFLDLKQKNSVVFFSKNWLSNLIKIHEINLEFSFQDFAITWLRISNKRNCLLVNFDFKLVKFDLRG